MSAASELSSSLRNLASALVAPESLELPEGLEAYRNNFLTSCARSLSQIYSVTEKVLGPRFFERQARVRAGSAFSRSPDLYEFGEGFPAHIAEAAAPFRLPYIRDLAELEWKLHRVLLQPEQPEWNPLTLQEVPVDRHSEIVFLLRSSCILMSSDWPVGAIWKAHQEGPEETLELRLDDLADFGEDAQERILVHRCAGRGAVEILTEAHWQVVSSISKGRSLGKIAELTMKAGFGEQALPDALGQLLKLDVISGIMPLDAHHLVHPRRV